MNRKKKTLITIGAAVAVTLISVKTVNNYQWNQAILKGKAQRGVEYAYTVRDRSGKFEHVMESLAK